MHNINVRCFLSSFLLLRARARAKPDPRAYTTTSISITNIIYYRTRRVFEWKIVYVRTAYESVPRPRAGTESLRLRRGVCQRYCHVGITYIYIVHVYRRRTVPLFWFGLYARVLYTTRARAYVPASRRHVERTHLKTINYVGARRRERDTIAVSFVRTRIHYRRR